MWCNFHVGSVRRRSCTTRSMVGSIRMATTASAMVLSLRLMRTTAFAGVTGVRQTVLTWARYSQNPRVSSHSFSIGRKRRHPGASRSKESPQRTVVAQTADGSEDGWDRQRADSRDQVSFRRGSGWVRGGEGRARRGDDGSTGPARREGGWDGRSRSNDAGDPKDSRRSNDGWDRRENRGRGEGGLDRKDSRGRRDGGWDRARDRDSAAERDRRRTSFGESEMRPKKSVIEEGYDYLYGISPVLNALAANRRSSVELFVQEGMKLAEKKDKAAVERLLRRAESLNVTRTAVDKHTLNLMSDNRPHQGFVLKTEPMEFTNIDALPLPSTKEGSLEHWLALDEVWDPQNLGALLRSAHFLGMKGVVVCAKNSASLSPVVSKASAGAMELMPVHSVRNMVKLLEKCKEQGYQVLGTSLDPDTVSLTDVDAAKPTVVVLGNEGHGMRTNVMRACDVKVRVEGGQQGGGGGEGEEGLAVDSLNVSVTGGILMHFLKMQQKP